MSLRLWIRYAGDHEVEFSRDGVLSFCDPSAEYEVAFAAMGGTRTGAALLLDMWRSDPANLICQHLGLEHEAMALLVADWAEHVLPLFETRLPSDSRPRLAIEASRKYISHEVTSDQVNDARRDAEAAERSASHHSPSRAALAAASTTWVALMPRMFADARRVAIWSVKAAKDEQAEEAWQRRRFVHVMERLRDKKPWPKIGETP